MNDKRTTTVIVLTLLHRNYSLGAVLQAYALYTTIAGLGYSCRELDYNNTEGARKLRKHIIAKGLRNPIDFLRRVCVHRNARRTYLKLYPNRPLETAIDHFVNSRFESTGVVDSKSVNSIGSEYDAYVVGGDQVWNPTWTDSAYFLDFARSGTRIAFSCSIGKDALTRRERMHLAKMAAGLDWVSVRERSAADTLGLEGIACKVIADPVFLLSSDEWRLFANESCVPETPYVFVYMLGEDPKARTAAKEFARGNALRIVSIPHLTGRYNPADEQLGGTLLTGPSPEDFIGVLANARCVLTDSYHATALSIILGRPFWCISRFSRADSDSQNSRLDFLLEACGLEGQIVTIEELGARHVDLPSERVANRLQDLCAMWRREAITYLTRCLGGVKK